MIKTENISFQYPHSEVLSFPNISCEQGQHTLILGQSGCGKSTLLHVLAGIRSPRSGSVLIGSTEINMLAPSQLDQFRGRHIGVVFQQSYFIKALSVRDNLLIAQSMAGQKKNLSRISELLDRLNVSHKAKSNTTRLSQGEQQRVAIARALVNHPNIILADEPTSALDDKNTDEVLKLLMEEANLVNASLLIVTHDKRLKDHFRNRIEL